MKQSTTHTLLLGALLTGAVGISGYSIYAATQQAQQQNVKSSVKGEAGPVSDIQISVSKPHDDGSADVTFTFKASTTYIDDYWNEYDGLDELTKIVIGERDENWDYQEIYTFENPEIGATLSATIENVSAGRHSYKIVAFNSLSGSTIDTNYNGTAYCSAYVGLDTPGEVNDLIVVNDYPKINLSWSAPTKGANNGYIDPAEFTYTVVRSQGYYNNTIIASGLTETSFEDELELTTLTQIHYEVYAVNSQGDGSSLSTPDLVVGPAAKLPFNETFPNGTAANLWTAASSDYACTATTYISSWGGKYTPFGIYLENSYDEDYGALCISCSNDYGDEDDAYCTYTSPEIDFSDVATPALSFYHYVMAREDNQLTSSIIIEQGNEQTTVKTFTYTEGSDGWNLEIIPLTQFAGKGNIKLIFRGDCNLKNNGFAAFDCISIAEQRGKDLKISDLSAPASVRSGDKFDVSVKVSNAGSDLAADFTINLYKDAELVASQQGENLESGAANIYTFTLDADNSYSEETTFDAEVVLDGDEDLTNNRTNAVTTAVRLAILPAVTDLVASYESFLKVNLEWSEPDYILPEGETVVDSFESYEHTATRFGDWTINEDNEHYPIYLEYRGLNYEEWQDDKMSFRVLDNTELTVTDATKWYGRANSGNKYLMSCSAMWGTRNDWLISPELSGDEQTLEFYAVSNNVPIDKYTDEYINDQIYVYASFTTADESAFTYKALANADDKTQPYELQNVLANGQDYEKISVALPEGTKYFALVVVTPDCSNSIVFFDDFSFTKAQTGIPVSLLGYNVYDNETKLNEEPISATAYQDIVENDTEHNYTVEAVYNVGASEKSNVANIKISDNSNSLNALALQNVRIATAAGQIRITAQTGTKAIITDYTGREISRINGSATINVAPGVYIVKSGNKTAKVVVK